MCKGSGKCLDQGVQTIPHDIYVIGTQETGMQERDWANRIMEILQDITGGTFHLVSSHSKKIAIAIKITKINVDAI